jgi:hypothetical protein
MRSDVGGRAGTEPGARRASYAVSSGIARPSGRAGIGRPALSRNVIVDLGRAAELAGHHDQHPAIEAAGVDVFDQGADRLVEVPAPRLHGVEDVVVDGVVVPVADAPAERAVEAGRHRVHAGLDQPARQQAALAPGIPPVSVAEAGVLLNDRLAVPLDLEAGYEETCRNLNLA